MSHTALAQVIMDKSPNSIKPLLYLAVKESVKWHDFMSNAEGLVTVGFPEKILNQIKTDNSKTDNKKTSTFCIWHGQASTHTSENCFKSKN
ncbi:hypothetical protein M153_7300029045 [Pseudoloma neurophilia]|uniref:Transposable element n=1 Tax=Pseudoloma neurophilia TaxID=146866 RepID=A0A0R0M7U8_9MICR|nr:hypothetical protein M153_7300029045 [Pseudoloma neurophilia]